ncbi:MAG: glycosyltransferase [Bacteroidales bacterium]|nr:glycosyltransferase [Bacteroidales bacterium]
MKLSIITVNLNNRDGLQKTIESVVSQTFRDFEWIIIDGGSTDGSKELIEQYADHFSYWISEPDKGIYNAMNKGIKVANGEYLQFLNSGDSLYEKDTLQKVFNGSDTYDILFGSCIVHDPYAGIYEHGAKDTMFTAFQLLSKSLPHQASFIKKKLFNKYGFYDEKFKICADMKFFYDVIVNHNATIRRLPYIIAHFDGDGISNRQLKTVASETECIAKEFLPNRLVQDFLCHNDILQKEGVIITCSQQMEENKNAIRLYNTMMRYWITRQLIKVMLKCLKLNKYLKKG